MKTRIPNHVTASLSELDLQTAYAVPPGGNWKDIPTDIPSARLDTIRRGFAAGNGSRSTYYGRLRSDRPSYTINTHFTRPGNGCHLHYDYDGGQHRTLSFREAARLQSFPDSFVFLGPKTSIAKQIGNAVPPLLAYQIARQLGPPGCFVDLFSGAGGLAQGFVWAGWQPLLANDIEKHFISTYRANIHDEAIIGDIRDKAIFNAIVEKVTAGRKSFPKRPLWVLGGPPCQGFSTAGKRRTMDDERNHLFVQYKAMIKALDADGFVFENVTGLLNMEKGSVFKLIYESLAEERPFLETWKLHSEQFAVPQRRSRVVLVGHDRVCKAPRQPDALTSMDGALGLFCTLAPAVTVGEALDDLPPLQASADGSTLPYRHRAKTRYQRLMRGLISPDEYLASFR